MGSAAPLPELLPVQLAPRFVQYRLASPCFLIMCGAIEATLKWEDQQEKYINI